MDKVVIERLLKRLWETESTTPKVDVQALIDALAADRTALEDLTTQRFMKRTIPADLFDKLSAELSDKIAVTESEIERASRFGVGEPMTVESLSARRHPFRPLCRLERSRSESTAEHPPLDGGANCGSPCQAPGWQRVRS